MVWIVFNWNLIVNDFYWIDYIFLIYKNWVLGELNGKVLELCGEMYISIFYWNDVCCDLYIIGIGIVCKKLF